jgi:uncharacterized membrane protein
MSIRIAPVIVVVGLFALATVASFLPPSAMQLLNVAGYAVCHRIPMRSFFIAQQQLPVCARDTGMFVGALFGLIAFGFLLRSRASAFPNMPQLIALGLAFALWAFDGFNSYIMLITGAPLFYMPQNWLRLVTGAFMGVSLSAFVVALWNQALWQNATAEPVVKTWREIAVLFGIALGIIGAVLWQPDWLYAPLALVSSAGIITLLSVVSTLIVIIAARQHGTLTSWAQLKLAIPIGVALALAAIWCIALLRDIATGGAGWPL